MITFLKSCICSEWDRTNSVSSQLNPSICSSIFSSRSSLLSLCPSIYLSSQHLPTILREMSSNRSEPQRGPSNRCPYATLNLIPAVGVGDDPSQNFQVSDDDIRDAYKRLSRLLHPDKRPPGRERDDAQGIFTEMMNACK